MIDLPVDENPVIDDVLAHGVRVAELTAAFSHQLGFGNYAPRVGEAAIYHDIGKVDVPEQILNKRGKLTRTERVAMKRHPELGFAILTELLDGEFGRFAAQLARDHHERWDGTGYPSGKSGRRSVFGARMMSLTDFYDALRSRRTYCGSMNAQAALEIISRDANGWDPDFFRVFRDNYDRLVAQGESSTPEFGFSPKRLNGHYASLGRTAP